MQLIPGLGFGTGCQTGNIEFFGSSGSAQDNAMAFGIDQKDRTAILQAIEQTAASTTTQTQRASHVAHCGGKHFSDNGNGIGNRFSRRWCCRAAYCLGLCGWANYGRGCSDPVQVRGILPMTIAGARAYHGRPTRSRSRSGPVRLLRQRERVGRDGSERCAVAAGPTLNGNATWGVRNATGGFPQSAATTAYGNPIDVFMVAQAGPALAANQIWC